MSRRGAFSICFFLLVAGLTGSVAEATTSEMYFSFDKNGQDRVAWVDEGEEI